VSATRKSLRRKSASLPACSGSASHVGDRHLSLINDQRDLRRAPLASVTALNYALQGLAERMDTGKDVLFLSISSHGSQNPA